MRFNTILDTSQNIFPSMMQQGGYTVGQFEGVYNLGTKRGRRKQKRLERLINRANSGSGAAASKLDNILSGMQVQQLGQQGYNIDPLDLGSRGFGEILTTDPNTGQSQVIDVNQPTPFEAGLSGVLNSFAPLAMNAVLPGLGTLGSNLNRNFSRRPSQQTQGGIGGMFGGFGGFGNPNSGFMNSLFGMDQLGGLFGSIASGGSTSPTQTNIPSGGFSSMFPTGQVNTSNVLGQLPFGGMFSGGLFGGGISVPGINGGMFGRSGNTGIGGGLGMFGFQDGGMVPSAGIPQLVDIQAEKGELIFHPTLHLTDVHASKSHKQMQRGDDPDMVTDHPLEGSFIFSDYLKIKKSDADDMVVGVKRYPYVEGKKGMEPETYTLADLYGKNQKKKTPAELARIVKNRFKVMNDDKDMFNLMGDELNRQNRVPYLEAIAALSEVEREIDDLNDQANEIGRTMKFKKGGRLKSRRVYRRQSGGTIYDIPPVDIFGTSLLEPRSPIDFTVTPNTPLDIFGRMIPSPVDPLPPSSGIGPVVQNNPTNPIDRFINPDTGFSLPWLEPDPGVIPTPTGVQTQIQDFGSPFLRGVGQVAIPLGGAITTGANIAGALGAYNLNDQFIDENRDFFAGQRGLVNQSRDIASAGSLFDVGLNLLQNAPEDMPINQATRLRQFDPNRLVNNSRLMADQTLGEINSLLRGNANPNNRAVNIGSAIAQNNQAIANAQAQAQNQQFAIDSQLDDIDFQNANIEAMNRQRRTDFGNNLINSSRQGFGSFFTNEASRPLDILGLNTAEREADIAFRQNRLFQPVQFASAAGNSLSNLGASALSLGTDFRPVTTPAYSMNSIFGQGAGGGRGVNIPGLINSAGQITNILGTLGVFGNGGYIKF